DEDDLGGGIALARDGIGPRGVESAAGAIADLRRDRLERRTALGLGHAGDPAASRVAAALTHPRSTKISAISTAFVAAPFRRLSLTTQNAMPRPPSIDGSWRTRPTNTSSLPAAVVASGYVDVDGSSWTTTPGTAAKSVRARSGVIGSTVSTWTASECATKTGIRTAVLEIRRSGRWRIFRLSVTTFHSSFVYPLSRKTSTCGRALKATWCG